MKIIEKIRIKKCKNTVLIIKTVAEGTQKTTTKTTLDISQNFVINHADLTLMQNDKVVYHFDNHDEIQKFNKSLYAQCCWKWKAVLLVTLLGILAACLCFDNKDKPQFERVQTKPLLIDESSKNEAITIYEPSQNTNPVSNQPVINQESIERINSTQISEEEQRLLDELEQTLKN